MYIIVERILKQMKNDKRTLIMLFLSPLLVLSVLFLILGDSGYMPSVGVYGIPEELTEKLEQDLKMEEIPSMPDPFTIIEEKNLDGFMWRDGTQVNLYMKEQNSKTNQLMKIIQGTWSGGNQISIQYQYETNDENQLDSLGYVFLGVLSFFIVFILSGMSFVSERKSQTLERMMMAPVSRVSVIGGYAAGYGILSAFQSILVILFSAFVLKLHFEGSVALCILIMVIMSFAAVLTGALISLFANNEFQMVQFIPLIIIPQIFYSGLVSIDTMPFGLGSLRWLMPSYYGCAALKQVMVYGNGIGEMWFFLAGLICYTGILFFLNTMALKKYRNI